MNVRASALCKVFEGGCSVRLPLLSALQQVLSAARHSSKSSPPALRARVLGTGEAEREGGAESTGRRVDRANALSTGRHVREAQARGGDELVGLAHEGPVGQHRRHDGVGVALVARLGLRGLRQRADLACGRAPSNPSAEQGLSGQTRPAQNSAVQNRTKQGLVCA